MAYLLCLYKQHPIRSSRPEVFCKKGVLRNFAKVTGKHLSQRIFLNKVAGQFSFFTEHLRWLLLFCALETALRHKYRRRNNLVILEKHTCLDNYIYSFGGNKKNHDFDSANSFLKLIHHMFLLSHVFKT